MSYRDYSTAKGRIVDPAGFGDFTTVQAAINASSSGQTVFIKNGIYNESITLKDGVDLTSFGSNGINGAVTINGKTTITSGEVICSGINFANSGDFSIVASGSAEVTLNFFDCEVNFSNHNGISFTNSNAGSNVFFGFSIISLGPAGLTSVSAYTMTSPGTLDFDYCRLLNQATSTTASTSSAGTTNFRYTVWDIPISVTSTGILNGLHSILGFDNTNTTAVTTAGTGSSFFSFCEFFGGTASAVSIGTGSTATISICDVNSSNTNAITGAGTLNAGIITFLGTSSTINTTTVNKLTTFGGTIV
jgi:hypothetical protein